MFVKAAIRRLVTVLPLIIAIVIGGQAAAQSDHEPPIKIGGLLPLTGMAAAGGLGMDLGIRFAITEINKAGGILGRQLVYVPADDQGDPAKGVTEARRLTTEEKVNFIVGPSNSAESIAVGPIITQANIVNIGVAHAQTLTPDKLPNWFTSYGSAFSQGSAMANYAIEVAKIKTGGILFDSGPNSRTIAQALKDHYTSLGGTVVEGSRLWTLRATNTRWSG
jgi:branched-chain amino acid transport system substrate-binding protein